MLGGRVITELSQSGQKVKGYVYAGGEVIARQELNQVIWQHTNPQTGSQGESNSGGVYSGTVEADPTGVNVGVEDPFVDPLSEGFEPSPDTPMIDGLGGNGCSSYNPTCHKCFLDGFEMNCASAYALLDSGAAALSPAQTVRWNPNIVNERGSRGAFEFFQAFGNGYSGWMTSYGLSNYQGGSAFYNSAHDDRNENRSWLTRSPTAAFIRMRPRNRNA